MPNNRLFFAIACASTTFISAAFIWNQNGTADIACQNLEHDTFDLTLCMEDFEDDPNAQREEYLVPYSRYAIGSSERAEFLQYAAKEMDKHQKEITSSLLPVFQVNLWQEEWNFRTLPEGIFGKTKHLLSPAAVANMKKHRKDTYTKGKDYWYYD